MLNNTDLVFFRTTAKAKPHKHKHLSQWLVSQALTLNSVLDTEALHLSLIVYSSRGKLLKQFSNNSKTEELSERLLSDDEG